MPHVNHLASAALLALHCLIPAGALAQATGIPSSIQAEHKELHLRLSRAIAAGGQTGAAAKEVEKLLAPHFGKEEQYAMPPLGHLAAVADGKVPADKAGIINMSDRLKQDMPEMLREHSAIAAAVQRLRKAALEERKPEAAQFADALTAHAREEEQILYPSAILVGEYLKLKR
ncbi:MAG TPA: hemerythrin domain-containing protein [Telluria sp.]